MSTTKNTKNVSNSDTDTAAAEAAATTTEEVTPETAAEETAAETKPATVQYEGVTNFVYIGASLPNGRLKSNTVLIGTYAEITEYYKEAIELYPPVAKLIVPVSQLAESREKAKKGGNLIHKYCQEVADLITPKGEEE